MYTLKSFKLPTDIKVFIQDSTINNSNSNFNSKNNKLKSNINIKSKLTKDSIDVNVNANVKVLFQKDNSKICINLPKELCLIKKGSILTLSLRHQPASLLECNSDSCPVIPLSVLKSITNIEPTTEILSLFGTWVNIISNILYGLSRGFHTNLILSGVGFRAQKKENNIEFKLGYSHLVNLPADPNIKLDIFKNTSLHLHCSSKEQLGNFAARIKHLRLPDAYKGKGVRVRGVNLRLKEGKKN